MQTLSAQNDRLQVLRKYSNEKYKLDAGSIQSYTHTRKLSKHKIFKYKIECLHEISTANSINNITNTVNKAPVTNVRYNSYYRKLFCLQKTGCKMDNVKSKISNYWKNLSLVTAIAKNLLTDQTDLKN